MINLYDLSDKVLLEEIERRKLQKSIQAPEPLKEPNWLTVYRMALDYIAQLNEQGYIDDDFKNYIFESVMEAVYGKDIWKFINSRS